MAYPDPHDLLSLPEGMNDDFFEEFIDFEGQMHENGVVSRDHSGTVTQTPTPLTNNLPSSTVNNDRSSRIDSTSEADRATNLEEQTTIIQAQHGNRRQALPNDPILIESDSDDSEPNIRGSSYVQERATATVKISQQHNENPPQVRVPDARVIAPNIFQYVTGLNYNLGRQVTVVQNGHRIVQQTMHAHDVSVQNELLRLHQQIDAFCSLRANSGRNHQEVKQFVLDHLFDRIREFQEDVIEPRVGMFGQNDNTHIQSRPFLEDRLFGVINVGLQRQELFGNGYYEQTPATVVNVMASCWLEARVWQLELLSDCTRELEQQNRAFGGSSM